MKLDCTTKLYMLEQVTCMYVKQEEDTLCKAIAAPLRNVAA